MPIYEYRCKKCGQHVELIQKVGEVARRKCDQCGGRLEKLVSRTAFVLKGGGWYSEGYSSSGGGKKKESAAAEGGGESKPAKGEPKSSGSKDEGKKAAGSA